MLGRILQRRSQLCPQLLFKFRRYLFTQHRAVTQRVINQSINRRFPVRFNLLLDVGVRAVAVRLVGYSGSFQSAPGFKAG